MKKFYLFLMLFAFCFACGCSSGTNSQNKNNNNSSRPAQTETTVLSSNQTQVAGKVTSIIGNEVVLALGEISTSSMLQAENNETSASNSENSSASTSSSENQDSKNSFRGNGQRPSGEMPSGEKPSGMPSGEAPSGEMPSGMPSGEAPSGEMPSGGNFAGRTGGKVEITLNGETGTYIIPVGLSLSGLSGNTTDFSAITEGMILRLTLETNSDSTKVIAAEVLSQ
jgi:hypothetical protein